MKVNLSFEAFEAALNNVGFKSTKQSEVVFVTRVEGKGRVEINLKGMFTVGAGSSQMSEIVDHCNAGGWETMGSAKARTYLKIKSGANEDDIMGEFISLVRHIETLQLKGRVSKKSADVVQLKPVATDDVKAKNLEMIRLAARKNKK